MPYGTPMQTGYVPPNAYNPNGMPYYLGYSYKSKAAAGVLGILLGALGIHNFYLGYTAKGVAQLMMTLCSCGILSWVSAIWGFIEGIMLLTGSINTDGNGLPLK
ncbi:MAG: TM2 domain-containing protein [Oscillospiraceae bacterium]|nr:TM2 domain-containing protein [Oscillospiraceae bacterium]